MADEDGSDTFVPPVLPEGLTLLRLQTDYATSLLASISYGVYLLMAIIILRQYWRKRRRSMGRSRFYSLSFTIWMLAVTTGWYVASAIYNTSLLAGGIFFLDMEKQLSALTMCTPSGISRDIFKSLQFLGADGLLLWRTFVIWDRTWAVIVVPFLVYLGLLGTCITYSLICLQTDLLNFDYFIAINLAQTAVTVVFNLLATGLIATKLIQHRRALKHSGLELVAPARLYTSLTSIFVESAGLYTLCGVLYLPFAEADSVLIDPFALLVRMLSFLGPALIQLRLAEGTAFESSTTSGGATSAHRERRRANSVDSSAQAGTPAAFGLTFASRSVLTDMERNHSSSRSTVDHELWSEPKHSEEMDIGTPVSASPILGVAY